MRYRLGIAVLAVATTACTTAASAPAPTLVAASAPATPPTTAPDAAPAAFALPDVTARPLTGADLAAMLPGGEPVVIGNADLIVRTAADPDDAAADVIGFRRETGVAASIDTDTGIGHVWIDLLADGEAAHRYLLDSAGDIIKRTGGTHAPEATAAGAREFPMVVGEESIGLEIDLPGARETAVLFRLGRLVVYVGLEHAADDDVRVPLQYLAERVRDLVVSTLAATPVTPTDGAVPPYRFETTITAEAGSETWREERHGVVSGDDLACTVRRVGPGFDETVTVRRIDGLLSAAVGNGGFQPVGGGDLATRSVLAACTSWPLDARAAGLDRYMTTPVTRHRVGGANAMGYTPDPVALATVLGSDLAGVAVESFSFWVAEGSDWVVELGFIAGGESAALATTLPEAWSELGAVRVSLRHRAFDLAAVDPAEIRTFAP